MFHFITMTSREERIKFRESAIRIRARVGASLSARLVGAETRSIHRWATGTVTSDPLSRRVHDLALIAVLLNPDGNGTDVRAWLNAMNPGLGYETPAEEIARGRWVEAIAAARDYAAGSSAADTN